MADEQQPETAAIFARIPRAQAEKLDRLSFELKRPKREILAGLVAEYEAREGDEWTLGRIALPPPEPPEVLTLEQLARLLQVSDDAARELAESGGLRGRRIGDEWRFSRKAVLDWLEGESE